MLLPKGTRSTFLEGTISPKQSVQGHNDNSYDNNPPKKSLVTAQTLTTMSHHLML